MPEIYPRISDVRKIFYKQQRQKNVIPEYAVLTNHLNLDILRTRKALKHAKGAKQRELFTSQLHTLLDEKRLKDDSYLEEQRQVIAGYIAHPKSNLRLETFTKGDKEYVTFNRRRRGITTFDRYVSLTLRKAFKTQTPGRDYIIRNVIDALRVADSQKDITRSIRKTDIEAFYENVTHSALLRKIANNRKVPKFALHHVRAVLNAYLRFADTDRGLPRGIPSSSILAEIYLEDLDNMILKDSRTVLYTRYVDDIVVILGDPEPQHLFSQVSCHLKNIGLKPRSDKTKMLSPMNMDQPSFDYLGYRFRFAPNTGANIAVDISNSKKASYINAIDNLLSELSPGGSLCWGDMRPVRKFIDSYYYLAYPHVPKGDEDSHRIVSGLAYNARLVRGEPENLKNIEGVFKCLHNRLHKDLESDIDPDLETENCKCCGKPLPWIDELKALFRDNLTWNKAKKKPARTHLEELRRNQIKEFLWK